MAALAWPAQPAAGAALQGADTFSLSSPTAVDASQPTTLVFDYAASSSDPPVGDIVTIEIPPGWTVSPSPVVTCRKSCQAMVTGTAVQVYINLDVNTTFVLDVQATAPGYAATSPFTTSEEFASTPPAVSLGSPQVIVNCPVDGTGTVNASPSSVTAGSSTNFTLTYQAGSCGVGVGGMITLTVPDTWTPPTTTAGAPGYTTWPGGQLSVSPDGTITVPVTTLAPEGTISVDYDMAQVPGPDEYMVSAAERSSSDGTLTALAPAVVQVTPPVTVTTSPPVTVTTSPPPSPTPTRGTGQMTVAPAQVTASHRGTLTFTYAAPADGLSSSGEVTVQVPAGWTLPAREPGRAGYSRTSAGVLSVSGSLITVTGADLGNGQTLTITYADATAPGLAGVSTFAASDRPDGAVGLASLATSPSVTVILAGSPAPASSPTVLWLVIGLAAVACAAGLLAVRRLGRRAHVTGEASVRAVPHPGPPTAVTVRDTGTRPTLVVRIERHASVPVITSKEARP